MQDTIKNIEAKQKPKKLVPLRIRLIRAGLSMKPRSYYLLSCLAGVVGGFIVLVTGSSPLVSLLAAFACGFGLPRWILARMIKRRQAKFLLEFANSIDIIVRGIKSGLALSDCMQIIARESPEPVRSEFADLIEQQKVGVPLSGAFERMYERMPLQEVNFFAIVIAIQNQIGGNLAEVLSNLAQVLRDRYRVQAKVRAFSAEAKASAAIIGALPPLSKIAMDPVLRRLFWYDNGEEIHLLKRHAFNHALEGARQRNADLLLLDEFRELAPHWLRRFPGDDLHAVGEPETRLDAAHNDVDGVSELTQEFGLVAFDHAREDQARQADPAGEGRE